MSCCDGMRVTLPHRAGADVVARITGVAPGGSTTIAGFQIGDTLANGGSLTGSAQAGAFVQAHPKEIVILDFNHFYAMSSGACSTLASKITSTFGSKLVPVSRDAETTVQDLWEAGQQVVVFLDGWQRTCGAATRRPGRTPPAPAPASGHRSASAPAGPTPRASGSSRAISPPRSTPARPNTVCGCSRAS